MLSLFSSSFLSIIPAIWILELKTNRLEILCLYIELVQESFEREKNSPGQDQTLKSNMLLDIMQVVTSIVPGVRPSTIHFYIPR